MPNFSLFLHAVLPTVYCNLCNYIKNELSIHIIFCPLCSLQSGLPGNCNEAESHKILDRFVELGGNFIDTANIYGRGTSETVVGNWLSR